MRIVRLIVDEGTKGLQSGVYDNQGRGCSLFQLWFIIFVWFFFFTSFLIHNSLIVDGDLYLFIVGVCL